MPEHPYAAGSRIYGNFQTAYVRRSFKLALPGLAVLGIGIIVFITGILLTPWGPHVPFDQDDTLTHEFAANKTYVIQIKTTGTLLGSPKPPPEEVSIESSDPSIIVVPYTGQSTRDSGEHPKWSASAIYAISFPNDTSATISAIAAPGVSHAGFILTPKVTVLAIVALFIGVNIGFIGGGLTVAGLFVATILAARSPASPA